MSEVVHLSFGPRANYLQRDYYHKQESYFVYSDEDVKRSLVDPMPRFRLGKEFTPRALFWDLNGGFGSLERVSNVYEQKETPDLETLEVGYSAVESWTDDLRIKLHPNSKFELANWHTSEHSLDGQARGSEGHSFAQFDEGADEFKHLNAADQHEYTDNKVRPLLEACDQLSGVNVVSDFGAWAGFANPILEAIRDDYAPKTTLVTWGLHTNSRLLAAQKSSFLQAMLGFCEWCDMVVPLGQPAGPVTKQAADQDLLFETVCLMSSLRKNRIGMAQLVDSLVANTSCNIVQGRAVTRVPTNDLFVPFKIDTHDYRLEFMKKHNPKYHSVLAIDRPTASEWAIPEAEISNRWVCPQPNDGFDSTCQLALSNEPLEMRDLVGSWQHELKERVHELTDPYIWGYESDSDFD